MRSRKEEPQWLAVWAKPLGIGALVGVVTCLVSLLGMAALLLTQDTPQTFVSPLALVALVVGCFVGGVVAARCAGQNGWLMGLSCGGVLFLLLLFGSGFAMLRSTAMHPLLKLAIMLLSAAVGGIVGINLKSRRA